MKISTKDEAMLFNNGKRKKNMDMVLTGISHELKGPLSTIKACTEGLINRIEKNKFEVELFRDYLNIINDEISRCTFVADNLIRSIKNAHETEKQKINIHDCLDQIITMLGKQGRCRDIRILKNYDSKLPPVLGTEYELLQVFLSIIVNAIDAMNGEGLLTIETQLHLDSIFIFIKNTGDAIKIENIESIFLPFYTTKAMQGGTGLGLFLAKNFVNGVGGNISVISDEQEGTTFTIMLPV